MAQTRISTVCCAAMPRLSPSFRSAGLLQTTALVLVIGLAATPGHADSIWVGITPDWGDAGNWSTGFVPGPADQVTIDPGFPVGPTFIAGPGIMSLDVNNAGDLQVDGALGVAADVTIRTGGAVAVSTGNFLFADTVGIETGGTLANAGTVATMTSFTSLGSVTNDGVILADVAVNGGIFDQNTGGSVTGATTVGAAGTVTNAGTLAGVTTAGSFTNEAGGTAGAVTNSGNGSNAGTVASLGNSAGTFGNTGTITGAAAVSGGTVTNTGAVGGTLSVTGGTFDQNTGGSVAGTATMAAAGTMTNAGTMADVTTAGSFTNEAGGTAGSVTSTGSFTNSGTTGAVTNSGSGSNAGTVASLGNTAGTFGNSGTITGAAAVSGGTVTNTGAVGGTLSVTGGTFDQNTGGSVTGAATVAAAGTMTNAGTMADVTTAGSFTNEAGGTAGSVTSTGSFTNAGTAGAVDTSGSFTNSGTAGAVTNSGNGSNAGTVASLGNSAGTFGNTGTITGAAAVSGGTVTNTGAVGGTLSVTGGTFDQNTGGLVAGTATVTAAGTLTNAGSLADVTTAGSFTNEAGGTAGSVTSTGSFTNSGTTGAVTNSGSGSNAGTVASLGNTAGTFGNSGTITGAAAVSGGTVTNTGAVGGTLSVTGGTFDQNTGGLVAGTATVAAAGTLTNAGSLADVTTAGSFTNEAGGTAGDVMNSGSGSNAGTIASLGLSAGTFGNTGTISGNVAVSGGTLSNTGAVGGTLSVTGGTFDQNTGGSVAGTATIAAAGTMTNAGTMADVTSAGTFTNESGGAAGTLTNLGAATNSGSLGALVNSAGLFALAGGTITGNAQIDAGQVTSTGTSSIGGTLSVDSGAEVRLGSGTLSVTGLTSISGVLRFLTDSSVFDGDVDGGTIYGFDGARLEGTVSNATLISLSADDGSSNGAGQIFSIAGLSGGSTHLQFDVDLSTVDAGVSDVFAVDDGNAATTDIDIDVGEKILLTFSDITGDNEKSQATDILLVSGSYDDPTIFDADFSGLVNGEYFYSLSFGSGTVSLHSQLDPAVTALAGSVALSQSLIAAVVSRPTSPFTVGRAVAEERDCAPGGWGRATGGHVNTSGMSSGTGADPTSSSVSASYSGVQLGGDLSCFNGAIGGWDMSFGGFVGFNRGSGTTDAEISALATSAKAGPTTSTFDQSYGGLYATASKGNLMADLQLRTETTGFTLNNPNIAGSKLTDKTFDTRATTLSGSISANFPLKDTMWNLAPTAGFMLSRSSSDTLHFDDTTMTLSIEDHTTKLGFAGLSASTVRIAPSGERATNYFLTGTYYHDFSGNLGSRFDDSDDAARNVTLSSETLGSFAEVSVGMSYLKVLQANGHGLPAKQFNASVRLDGRFSGSMDSTAVTAQARWQF